MIKASIMVFTRDPSDTEQVAINGYQNELHLGGTANMCRLGALSLGYNGYRAGWWFDPLLFEMFSKINLLTGMLDPNPTLESYLLQAIYIVKELPLAIRILYGPFKWFSYEIISYIVLHYVTFWL